MFNLPSPPPLFLDLEPPAVQLQLVPVVEGVVQSTAVGKLHYALAVAGDVNVGVRDVTRDAEVILQVL